MRCLLPALLVALAGCSAFGPNGNFRIEADPPTLVLDNETGETVYYVALTAGAAVLIDLDPDVTSWPSLAADQTLRIPYDDLAGYDEGDTEAVVYWSTGEGYTPVRVRL